MVEVSKLWAYGNRIILGREVNIDGFKNVLQALILNADEKTGRLDKIVTGITPNYTNEELIYDEKIRSALYLSAVIKGVEKAPVLRFSFDQPDDIQRIARSVKEEPINYISLQFDAKGLDEERKEKILIILSFLKDNGFDVETSAFRDVMQGIDSDIAYLYTNKELKYLEEINDFSKSLFDRQLNFQMAPSAVSTTTWPYDDVYLANKTIRKVATTIKNYDLSPFETALLVYKYSTSFNYVDSSKFEDSRVLMGIYGKSKPPAIVCVGHSTAVKAPIDLVKMNGLSAKFHTCNMINTRLGSNEEGPSGHINVLVSITDKKYGIDGTYILDASLDAPKYSYDVSNGFLHACLPIEDLKHYKKRLVRDFNIDTMQELVNAQIEKRKLNTDSKFAFVENFQNMIKVLSSPCKAMQEEVKGKAIPISAYAKAYTNVLRAVYPTRSEQEIKSMVDEELAKTLHCANIMFDKRATNCFKREASKYREEELAKNYLEIRDKEYAPCVRENKIIENIILH